MDVQILFLLGRFQEHLLTYQVSNSRAIGAPVKIARILQKAIFLKCGGKNGSNYCHNAIKNFMTKKSGIEVFSPVVLAIICALRIPDSP